MADFIENKNGTKTPNPGSILDWLEKSISIIDRYGIIKIVQALLVIFMSVLMLYWVLNPEKAFEMYDRYEQKAHQELINRRVENTPKIQDVCDGLVLKTGARRALFLELHNNTSNLSGMPFFYASSSCEGLDDGVEPIAEQYKEVKLSLVPFATHLSKVKYWEGDMEELKKYDKSLYYRMMSNGAGHSVFMMVEGLDYPRGILVLTFTERDELYSPEKVKCEMEKAARKIALYVEAPSLIKQ